MKKIQNELFVSNLTTKKFWSLTNVLLGAISNMSMPFLHHNGICVSDNAQKAELIKIYFSSLLDNIPSLPPFYYKIEVSYIMNIADIVLSSCGKVALYMSCLHPVEIWYKLVEFC